MSPTNSIHTCMDREHVIRQIQEMLKLVNLIEGSIGIWCIILANYFEGLTFFKLKS